MRRLLSPGWLALHASAIVFVLAFLRLGWWQWERATETGSAQSYGYAFQWPVFALFVIFMWVKMVRDDGTGTRTEHATTRAEPYDIREPNLAPTTIEEIEEDEQLAAYNRYLARLNANADQHR